MPMSGKHITPILAMPRLAGSLAAGFALAVTLAGTHLSDTGSSTAFAPKLSSATFPQSEIASSIGKVNSAGSQIAAITLKNVAAGPETKSEARAGAGAGAITKVHAKRGTAPASPELIRAADVIKLAKKQVGVSETNGYGGGTKYQKWYAKSHRAKVTVRRDGGSVKGYKNAAWCSIFISWLGHKLKFNKQMGNDAWTVAHAQWFKEHGRWGHKPKAGAVVFFSWSGGSSVDDIDHVGLVTKKLGHGRIRTIEGNKDDSVTKQTRSTSLVVGYGYPDYAK
ncbi:MAG: domain containing protein [Streptosporangiaceae bacterium]|jgi:hypothetical protein|nr:domain containing protein [Streptosporangiaceae bacterium]